MIKTIEFKTIAIELLVPHPDAMAYPTDADDRCAIDCSLAEQGLIQPIIVTIGPPGKYFILDGIGRVDGAQKAGMKEVECKVVSCTDPRSLALTANGSGRKRTTGSRILTYLMQHQADVLRAAACVAEQKRRNGGGAVTVTAPPSKGSVIQKMDWVFLEKGAIPPSALVWTSRPLALRLGASNKDILCAIDLLICQTQGEDLHGKPLDDDGRKILDETFGAVVCGRTPIRRWRAALAGKSVPAEESGKAATNHGALALRSITSLQTAFGAWQDINHGSRELILSALSDALDQAPEDVLHLLAERYARPESKGKGKRS
jgi:hypothetical protein